MSQNLHQDPEKDPVWDLLGTASDQKPSPLFSQNVMRAIRLEQKPEPFWKRILAPRPALAGLAAAAACVAITVAILQQEAPENGSITGTPSSSAISSHPEVPTAAITEIAAEYNVPEDLDEIIDPLMLISVMGDTSDYSLDELGL